MRKIGAAAAMAAMTIVVAALCGVALADDGHVTKPAKPAPPPKAAKHDQSKPAKPAKSESASKPDKGNSTEPEAKVYICHATGSKTNPYVLIHVSSHALKAHTSHQDGRDIVLGAAPGACPGASTSSDVKAAEHSQSSEQKVSFCDMETATTGKFETKDAKEVVKHELNGTPEEARDIVPPFTFNGQTYSQLWDANGQAIFAAHCGQSAEVKGASVELKQENGKVFICHATGSATNPYVLIHVSVHALKAHTRHHDGRDIVLGASSGSCPTAAVSAQSATQTCADDDDKAASHDDNGKGDDKNGVDRDQKAKHEDNDDDDSCPPVTTSSQSNFSAQSESNTSVSSNTAATQSSSSSTSSNTASTASVSSNTVSSTSNTSAAAAPTQSGAVLGATKALASPKAPVLSAKASGGVLGTVAKISSAATSGTLPFSGISLWIVELIALGLIGLGVATRLVVRRSSN